MNYTPIYIKKKNWKPTIWIKKPVPPVHPFFVKVLPPLLMFFARLFNHGYSYNKSKTTNSIYVCIWSKQSPIKEGYKVRISDHK